MPVLAAAASAEKNIFKILKIGLDKANKFAIIITVTITVKEKFTVQRYSRQREAILQSLRSVTSHPTAAQLCDMVCQTVPNISLGTVYRNLSELTAAGEILCFKTNDGSEHYDGNALRHPHLVCRQCRRILDLTEQNGQALLQSYQAGCNHQLQDYLLIFYGLCADCKTKTQPGS